MIISPDSSMHSIPQLPESTTSISDFTTHTGHREPALNLVNMNAICLKSLEDMDDLNFFELPENSDLDQLTENGNFMDEASPVQTNEVVSKNVDDSNSPKLIKDSDPTSNRPQIILPYELDENLNFLRLFECNLNTSDDNQGSGSFQLPKCSLSITDKNDLQLVECNYSITDKNDLQLPECSYGITGKNDLQLLESSYSITDKNGLQLTECSYSITDNNDPQLPECTTNKNDLQLVECNYSITDKNYLQLPECSYSTTGKNDQQLPDCSYSISDQNDLQLTECSYSITDKNDPQLPECITNKNDLHLVACNYSITDKNDLKLPECSYSITDKNDLQLTEYSDSITDKNDQLLSEVTYSITDKNDLQLPECITNKNDLQLVACNYSITDKNDLQLPECSYSITDKNDLQLPEYSDSITDKNDQLLSEVTYSITDKNDPQLPECITNKNDLHLVECNYSITDKNDLQLPECSYGIAGKNYQKLPDCSYSISDQNDLQLTECSYSITDKNDPQLPECITNKNDLHLVECNYSITDKNDLQLPECSYSITDKNDLQLPEYSDSITDKNDQLLSEVTYSITDKNDLQLPECITNKNDLQLVACNYSITDKNDLQLPECSYSITDKNDLQLPEYSDSITDKNDQLLSEVTYSITDKNDLQLPECSYTTDKNDLQLPECNNSITDLQNNYDNTSRLDVPQLSVVGDNMGYLVKTKENNFGRIVFNYFKNKNDSTSQLAGSSTNNSNLIFPKLPICTMNIPDNTKIYKKAACSSSSSNNNPSLEPASENYAKIEFDGTTVLCRVCGDKASGFHYGVHSCEGCKGFFRRSIQQKIQYRPCTKNQQCSILRINRNRCQYCRLRKCISVGMSRDAVRFGRVPKREKARILAAMQQSSNSRSLENAIAAELEDDQRLLETVVRAHIDTCDYTRDKVTPMIRQARNNPSYTACPTTMACPLHPNPQPLTGQEELLQDFSKRFSPVIRGVVEFSRLIPGFILLPQDEQVTLLKAGVFEVLIVRLACLFDSQTATMICLNGQVLKRGSFHNSANARFLMDSMFDFAERLNSLRLSDAEIGLFCSIVMTAPDRPGLRNREVIEKIQNKLKAALQMVVAQNHQGQTHFMDELMKKISDLRTLNTLHSEKLLAFKSTEQHQQNLWNGQMDEDSSKSPVASSWSSSSDVTMDEAKSPLGSVSSTESMCSEMTSLHEYTHPNSHTNTNTASSQMVGGISPHRYRANSGSTSSGDDDPTVTSHLIQNGITITPVSRPMHNPHSRFRKLESPSDSGIESGTEKVEKPTSVCSSPRSSVDDHHIVEDMPVLKRVLQAPPLYDTNSLMDEAYKPHKKFRAFRNKDSAEAEPVIIMSPQPVQSQLQMQLNSTSQSALSSSHSMLAKSLMEGPRMTAEQMKRTEVIHNFIMRGDSASPMVTATPPACPYKSSSWATSVITTTARQNQMHGSQTPPLQDYNRLYLHPQSPHSTSPAPPQSRSPASPHSSLLTSLPKMVELQVDIADSQQPLNLSKKSPSPSPRPMKVVTLEV